MPHNRQCHSFLTPLFPVNGRGPKLRVDGQKRRQTADLPIIGSLSVDSATPMDETDWIETTGSPDSPVIREIVWPENSTVLEAPYFPEDA
jgi:hypothetical protein